MASIQADLPRGTALEVRVAALISPWDGKAAAEHIQNVSHVMCHPECEPCHVWPLFG